MILGDDEAIFVQRKCDVPECSDGQAGEYKKSDITVNYFKFKKMPDGKTEISLFTHMNMGKAPAGLVNTKIGNRARMLEEFE